MLNHPVLWCDVHGSGKRHPPPCPRAIATRRSMRLLLGALPGLANLPLGANLIWTAI